MTKKTLQKLATTAILCGAFIPLFTPTLATAKPTTAKANTTATVSPEKAILANDLIAFNKAINRASIKSQKLQTDFITKHKNDKSPDVQVLFIKEAIKSLDQQAAELQAVTLSDPKAIAMRDKFLATIALQKSAYTFMVNTPHPTQAQQDNVAKQMADVQVMGVSAQKDFIQLANDAGLMPESTQ